MVVSCEVTQAIKDSNDGGKLGVFVAVFGDGILTELFREVVLSTLITTLSNQITHLKDIFISNTHIQWLYPLLVCLLQEPIIIMDLTKFFETDSHTILDKGFHLWVDLTVFLSESCVVFRLKLASVESGGALQMWWHLSIVMLEVLCGCCLQFDIKSKAFRICTNIISQTDCLRYVLFSDRIVIASIFDNRNKFNNSLMATILWYILL